MPNQIVRNGEGEAFKVFFESKERFGVTRSPNKLHPCLSQILVNLEIMTVVCFGNIRQRTVHPEVHQPGCVPKFSE